MDRSASADLKIGYSTETINCSLYDCVIFCGSYSSETLSVPVPPHIKGGA